MGTRGGSSRRARASLLLAVPTTPTGPHPTDGIRPLGQCQVHGSCHCNGSPQQDAAKLLITLEPHEEQSHDDDYEPGPNRYQTMARASAVNPATKASATVHSMPGRGTGSVLSMDGHLPLSPARSGPSQPPCLRPSCFVAYELPSLYYFSPRLPTHAVHGGKLESMTEIQPTHVDLDRLLYRRLFRIPDYQRSYSWGNRHRQDLFEDIERIVGSKDRRSHFMATVVGLRRTRRMIGTDEYQFIDIVDGQQRLTTLIVLLKAIAMSVNREEKGVRDEIDSLLIKNDNATPLLLQTNHDGSHIFADYLRTGNHPAVQRAKSLADRNILQCMTDCERFIGEWRESGRSTGDLFGLIKNKLTFILYEINDEALVYSVFEVLNSRGLEVSWFDRLKNMLMGVVFEHTRDSNHEAIKEIHELWATIYRIVGLRIGLSNESMCFAATLCADNRPSRPLGEEDAANLLVERSKTDIRSVIDTTSYLVDVTESLGTVYSNHKQRTVTSIRHVRLVATAVHLRRDLSHKEKETILNSWERISFRIYGMYGKDSRTLVGHYTRLAWNIMNRQPSADDILSSLAAIGQDFPIDDAVRQLSGTDCYSDWEEQLQYFFFRYEEHLARESGQRFSNAQWNRIWAETPAHSIEHIRPQSRSDENRIHRLGNLLLLDPGLNSKLQDKPVVEKADAYMRTGFLSARCVAEDVLNLGIRYDWTYAAIERREKALLEFALQEWAD